MSINKVAREAGCYLMPSWEAAMAQSGGGFDDGLHSLTFLAARESHLSPPPPFYWKQQAQQKISNHHLAIYIAALKSLFSEGSTQEGENKQLTVLDVGGSYGAFYYELKRLCPELRLKWTVLETPSTCKVLHRFDSDEISWTSTMPTGEKFALTFVSGTLPYLKTPYDELSKWANISKRICLSMLPLVEQSEDLIYLQYVNNANNISAIPGHFFSRPKLVAHLQSFGHIEAFWEHPPHMPLRIENVNPTYYSILVRSSTHSE